METVWQDVRYGARMLWRSPGFTLVALIALALGIGANTAIFSVVNAVLLRTLPYREPARLVIVWEHFRDSPNARNTVAPANMLDWQAQAKSVESMAGFFDAQVNMTGLGEPQEVSAQLASANLFTVLGADAALGRTFAPDEAEPGHDPVVVVSHGFWQGKMGGASDVLGKTISLNGRPVTIVGVMPPDFKWFIKENSRGGKPAEMWLPYKFTNAPGRFIQTVARLKPGVTVAQADAELNTIEARIVQERPQFNQGVNVVTVPLREQFSGELKRPLMVLLGAVAFVLLIACANVANLMLARAAARSKEIAVRAALGAGRARIVRQLLTESLLLALAGGLAGGLLALWGVDALVALSPPNLITAGEVGVSLPVLGFTFAVSLLTGIIFGLLPALEAARFDPNEALKESGRGTSGSPRARRFRSALVVSEIALALVLLVGAGLMIRSFARLGAVDPGFDPNHLLTMRVQLPPRKYKEDAQVIGFFRQATERIAALPGVRAVTVGNFLPFYTGLGARTGFTIEGRPVPPGTDGPSADVRVVDENYFSTLRIPILAGRAFTHEEATQDRRTIIVTESLARRYFPGESPLGKRIAVEMSDKPEMHEIVGVVGDVRYEKLNAAPFPMVYWTIPQLTYSGMSFVIRTDGDPLALAPAARNAVQEIDRDQPVADLRTMESWVGESMARARFGTLLLTVFAGVALLLAAVGVYGVMAYSVTQRQHEIGIRIALGAQTRDVLRMIVRQGMLMALAGIGVGLIGAFALTRVMATLLYGVSATDPVTFAGVPLLLACVALFACYVPARRATRVDPMVALRYE